MAAGSSQRDDILSDINVTPLVDVMLVLLIVMMVTASYVISRSLDVNLPQASTGRGTSEQLVIGLDQRGNWLLNGRPTSEAGLRTELRARRARDAELSVLVAADGKTPHELVVRLLDVIRGEQIQRVAVGVTEVEE